MALLLFPYCTQPKNCLRLIVSVSAPRNGTARELAIPVAECGHSDQPNFLRSLSRDGRIGLIVGPDDLADPDRIIDRIEVLVAEIRGYGDDGVAAPELRSHLLHSAQDGAGASSNKQVMIASERKAGVNGAVFTYGYDSVRLGEVCERWSHARADAGNVSFPGCAAKCDRADRLDGHNLDPGEFLMEFL